MTLYLDETIDPVAALGLRECKSLPLHFTTIKLGIHIWNIKPFRSWITKNLTGRFFVGERHVSADFSGREFIVGFEDPGEATLFALILPSLKEDDILF